MATIQFKPLEDTNIHYKGKYVRFSGKFAARKSSHLSEPFVIQPGTIGLCYVSNGATLHIGFQSLKPGIFPDRHPVSITRWPYHIAILPHSEGCWEIESQ